jgi:predicted secreted protein
VLWLLEIVAAVMAAAYLWELCDALGTEHWRRRVTAGSSRLANESSATTPSCRS